MLQKCSSAASSGGLKSVDAAQKINAWHCCPILVSACSCLTIKVLTSHIHCLTVLFNQMNLTGFWNVLFLHEKGFWNDHLKCKVHIYFDACPAMPHAIVFRENSRTCRKIQRNLLWFKRNHFQDSSMDTHRPVSSLTTHPIYCVYHAKSIYIFFCKHRPGLDAKFKNSKLSHRMCAAHA